MRARVWHLPCVFSHVAFPTVVESEALVTDLTPEGLVLESHLGPRIGSPVVRGGVVPSKTLLTGVRFLTLEQRTQALKFSEVPFQLQYKYTATYYIPFHNCN